MMFVLQRSRGTGAVCRRRLWRVHQMGGGKLFERISDDSFGKELLFLAAHAAKSNGEHNDEALDHHLDIGVHIDHVQAVGDHREDEDAKERAAEAAGAAGDADAAEDGGGHRVHVEAFAVIGVAAVEAGVVSMTPAMPASMPLSR